MTRNVALQFINVAHFFCHYFLLIFPTAALALAPKWGMGYGVWGMGYGDVLLYATPLYFMFALGTLPAGWLGDRVDRMKLIAVFYAGCGLSALWISVAAGPIGLMVGLGALGLFAAIYHPVGLAHVTQIGLRTGRALAVNGVFGNMGLAAAAVTTGLLAQVFGWQSAFAIPGLVSLLIGCALYFRHRRSRETFNRENRDWVSGDEVAARRTQWTVFGVICVAALFGGMVFNMVTISLPKFLDERLTGEATGLVWIGASAGLAFAIAAFAQLPVGELLDRVGARPVLLSLLAGQTVLLLVLIQASGYLAMVAALLVVVLIFAEIPITSWLIGQYLNAGIRSRALSVEYVLSLGVGSTAVPLIAWLQRSDLGFTVQFSGLAVATVVIFCAGLFLPGRRSPA